MRLPKKGEKGFTLIELLIVVAILGVLAAVVIPNVGRFIGRGEQEAKDTELSNIQSAVQSMMVDNNLQSLDDPEDDGSTDNMSAFPDETATYILYGFTSGNLTINYVATPQTAYYYTVDALGTVHQHDTSGAAH